VNTRHKIVSSVRASLALLLTAIIVSGGSTAAVAADYVPISGAGSSWSANALDQWRRNVKQYGMSVNYASTGSVDGRNQFKGGTVDFAVSETPYGLKDNGVVDELPTRPFIYIPIVAGGTAFMYNLTSGGNRITNLRLSGDVVTKMFTGVITKWNDKLIAADNPGITLPDRAVVPVVRSDGSGSTSQFTLWMATKYKSLWDNYCDEVGRDECGQTSFYPTKSGMVAQPGSQGVSGYVAQKANEGTITYVEYSYALKTNFPVAKVLNDANFYVEPTASNVAVGLLGAEINQNESSSMYLTQELDGVYNSKDPRAYPLSSYSYIIVPTTEQASFTATKGATLSAFTNYFLCEGQQQAEVLGYSPLPVNLVKVGLEQVTKIPGADASTINIAKCNNPTFSASGENTLAKNAPMPDACDEKGVEQCTAGTGGASGTSTGTTGTTGTGTTGTTGTGTTGVVMGGTMGTGPTTCDADTGVCSNVKAVPVATTSTGWAATNWIILSVIIVLVLVVVVPPVLVTYAARKVRSS
jgi:phosphate ABC transporter phosphate-binding protein